MSLRDFLTVAAPIAAGSLFGPGGAALAAGSSGTAIAAGAVTGAGIAALSGDDPLMGAISGGMGGYGGAGIGQAMNTTALGSAGAQQTASGITFDAATGQTIGGGLGGGSAGAGYAPIRPAFGEGFKASINDPKAFLSNLGGGARFDGNKMITESDAAKKGAIKLGAVGLPAIGQALVPDYNANPDDDPMSKYDPKRRLNVNMPTGIQNAMTRDSGLRLNQPFAQFAEGGYLPYRFQDSGNFTPEDQEAYRQYMTLREYNSNRREPSKDVVYDEGLQAIENERARSMRDPQSVENLRAYQMRDKVTDEERRVRYQSLFDSFARDRAELDAMPEGPEKDSLIEGNDNFTREEFNMGGYLETGMGDGMSDDISTSIDGEQPAALSEGEFVVPADVVSGLGNGSSDAGAEQLYAMMDRIRKARTGTEKQGREIMPQEYMPA